MDLPSLIREFAVATGLAECTERRDGSYSLLFDQSYRVRLLADGPATVMVGRLGLLPDRPEQRHAVLERLLGLALGRLQDHGETLSLDEDEQTLVLHQRLEPDTDRLAFERHLERFVNAMALWQKALTTLAAPVPPRPTLPMMPIFR